MDSLLDWQTMQSASFFLFSFVAVDQYIVVNTFVKPLQCWIFSNSKREYVYKFPLILYVTNFVPCNLSNWKIICFIQKMKISEQLVTTVTKSSSS